MHSLGSSQVLREGGREARAARSTFDSGSRNVCRYTCYHTLGDEERSQHDGKSARQSRKIALVTGASALREMTTADKSLATVHPRSMRTTQRGPELRAENAGHSLCPRRSPPPSHPPPVPYTTHGPLYSFVWCLWKVKAKIKIATERCGCDTSVRLTPLGGTFLGSVVPRGGLGFVGLTSLVGWIVASLILL